MAGCKERAWSRLLPLLTPRAGPTKADGLESGGASTPGECPPQRGRKRSDDHQAVDDAYLDSTL
jgi:hypothetical protein